MHSLQSRLTWALCSLGLVQGAVIKRAEAALASLNVHQVDDVRGNLMLPRSIDGLDIEWSTSDDSIITSDGRVKRQSAGHAEVHLTARVAGDDLHKRTFTANVRQAVAAEPLEGYAFSYFTQGTASDENIFFAASNGNNALDWTQLNGGQPVLTSDQGTRGLRDPFLIRSYEGDRFWLIATDLQIGTTDWGSAVRTGSRYLEIWESNDLVNWSEQRHILVSPENAGNTWAPEAYYDEAAGEYIVFWASSLYADDDPDHTGDSYHRMLYATTRDFVNFSETTIWQDSGLSRIDTTLIKEGSNYYRFTKDEGGTGSGCSDILQETSTQLRAPVEGWTLTASCIGANAGLSAVEGPTIFKSNPDDANGEKFYLFVDEYGQRGYIPLETADIANPDWKVSASYNLPSAPRHGTVLPVTAAELSFLRSSLGASAKREEETASSIVKKQDVYRTLPGLYADPNIIAFGCDYYIYATTDGFEGWGGNVFYTWKSSDLVTWTRAEEPFLTLDGENGNVPWATGNAWAPTIIERDGKYYFYFSGHNAEFDRKTIGVAVADHPEGPFTAQPEPMILNNEAVTSGQAIDPAAFRDPVSGKYYIFWGNGSPVFAELNDDMVSINLDTLAAMSGLEDYREGSFINYRDGIYHLTYSIDDTGSENYRVGYATAPAPTGPWTYQGVILEKDTDQGILGTGHNSILNVPGTDDWYIVYHRFHIPDGNGTNREVAIDVLTFGEDGLIQPVKPSLEAVAPQSVPSCAAY